MTQQYPPFGNSGPAQDWDRILAERATTPAQTLEQIWNGRADLRSIIALNPACPRHLIVGTGFADPWSSPVREGSGRTLKILLVSVGAVVVATLVGMGIYAVKSGGIDESPNTSEQAKPTLNFPLKSGVSADTKPLLGGAIVPTSHTADCVIASPGKDSGGATFTYEPEKAFDGDLTTAWRCVRSADSQKITFALGRKVTLSSVALVPGFAKTDPDGSDRFMQNRKIIRVLWEFSDKTTVEQSISPSRAMAVQPVNVITDSVTMTILETVQGEKVINNQGVSQDSFDSVVSVSEIEFKGA
ncbi:MAG: discoidin domain-containing protein [Mycobacteriaceae bacterium]